MSQILKKKDINIAIIFKMNEDLIEFHFQRQ